MPDSKYWHGPISFSVWPMCLSFYFDNAKKGSSWSQSAHILLLVRCHCRLTVLSNPLFTLHASPAPYGSNMATRVDRDHFNQCLCLHQQRRGTFQQRPSSGFSCRFAKDRRIRHIQATQQIQNKSHKITSISKLQWHVQLTD